MDNSLLYFPLSQTVHVLVAAWQGTATESEEMQPIWVPVNALPFEHMWQDAVHWLPLILEGKYVQATFIFNDDNESLALMTIEVKQDDAGRQKKLTFGSII